MQTLKGATLPTPWGNNSDSVSSTSYSYSGDTTTETDAADRSRTETRDALGRITSVTQGGLISATYTYYASDLLKDVTQTDTTYGTAGTQKRDFTYDSLGRLKIAKNPESGETKYEYYKGGSLKTRKDARNVIVTFTYDNAQRLKSKSYSDATTPSVLHCYDGEVYNAGICAAHPGRDADALDFPRGRLTGVGTSKGWTNHTRIDGLGRTPVLVQGVEGLGERKLEYTFAASGAVESIMYPSGRKVTYALGDTGRVTGVTGVKAQSSTTYATGRKYGAGGMLLKQDLEGASLIGEARTFNWLGQMTGLTVNSGVQPRFAGTWTYGDSGNNGNLLSQTTSTGTRTFTQYCGYDAANRLRLAMEKAGVSQNLEAATCSTVQASWPTGQWCVLYEHDKFGNAWSPEAYNAHGLKLTSRNSFLHATGTPRVNNRISGVAHDDAGYQTQVDLLSTGKTAEFDGEGRVSKITNGAGILGEYSYNGEGKRVKRVAMGGTTYYVYGLDGETAQEYQEGGPPSTAGREYVFADHLGSPRLKLSSGGTVLARHDYEPYGAEIARTGEGYGNADDSPQRFTGKERDLETSSSTNPAGLDYFGARYFSAVQGRFTSADLPFADQRREDPQSWNLYSYVRNNPLKNRDPNGRWCVFGVGTTCSAPTPPSQLPNAVPSIDSTTLLKLSRQPRNISERGVNFIASWEKFHGQPYHATKKEKAQGKLTIGYGHVVKPGEQLNSVTEPQAKQLLRADLARVERSINKRVEVWISQERFDALTSLGHNIGPAGVANSTAVRKANEGAASLESEFTSWNKQAGEVLDGLTNRRLDEYEIISKGDYERTH